MLPNEAKLEFARLTRARGAQAEIASSLLKSFTAVCGVIGVQPIPLADMPILTTLQSLLVGLIIYVSGRQASARLIAEFAGALGVSIGAGFAFREGARALLKIFPIWGNAISGIVAGAGTYAVGRAAIAYFIEDLPLQETRKLFAACSRGWIRSRRGRCRSAGASQGERRRRRSSPRSSVNVSPRRRMTSLATRDSGDPPGPKTQRLRGATANPGAEHRGLARGAALAINAAQTPVSTSPMPPLPMPGLPVVLKAGGWPASAMTVRAPLSRTVSRGAGGVLLGGFAAGERTSLAGNRRAISPGCGVKRRGPASFGQA